MPPSVHFPIYYSPFLYAGPSGEALLRGDLFILARNSIPHLYLSTALALNFKLTSHTGRNTSNSVILAEMAQAVLHHWLCVFALQLSLLAPVRGSSDSSSYANLSTAFPPLQDLDNFPLHRDPRLGGQNFTVCCLLAVNQSYQIQQDGQVSQAADPQSRFINLTPDQLNNTQFPCGATYNNNDTGAPLVTIPYSWCASNCGGWQQSTNRILTQWIQPFVGFILPAAVFCLNVRAHTCMHRDILLIQIVGSTKEGTRYFRQTLPRPPQCLIE